jgi:hypothetical protein
VRVIAGGAHHVDDLFDRRRIGRIAHTFVARRSTDVEAGHGRGRSTSTSSIEQRLRHCPSSGLSYEPKDRCDRSTRYAPGSLTRPLSLRHRSGIQVGL